MRGVAPAGLFVQLCSFVSSVAFAHILGATAETDGYYLGLSIPLLAFGLFVGSLRQGAIPTLTDLDAEAGSEAFAKAGGELLRGITLAAAVVTVAAVAASELLAPVVASGATLRETRIVLLELVPYGVSGAVVGVLGALLAVRGVFVLPVVVVAAESVLKIVLLLAFGQALGIQALVLGNVGGSAFAVVLLTVSLRRHGVMVALRGPINSSFVRRTLALSVPVLVSLSVLQVNPLIDRTMAASLGDGKVTALELGLRLYLIPAGLVIGLLVSPITATWSARYASGGRAALEASVADAIRCAFRWVPPVAIAAIAVRREVVDVLFGGGVYPISALHDTASVLGAILLSLPAQVLTAIFATVFVVQKDTRFPMKIAFANVLLNVVLNLALRPTLGVAGIALSTTITYTILVSVYFAITVRRWGLGIIGGRTHFMRSAASAVLCSGVAVVLVSVLPTVHTRTGSLLAVAVVATGVLLAHFGVLAVGGVA
jgi:putative peptidoglycan lipid II flippase